MLDSQPKKPKVLVTDDDLGTLENLKSCIESWGYEVVALERKVEALERLGEIKPDLVTTDLNSPELGGLAFIRALKKLDPSIPVIIISGYEELEAAREAVRLGVLDYLNKPFDCNFLRGVVEAALKTRTEHQKKEGGG
jgi:putative two-component system response regulator